jgi:hypothetical protein
MVNENGLNKYEQLLGDSALPCSWQHRASIADPETGATFFLGARGYEMLRIGADGTFSACGETIADVHDVYNRINAWLGIAEAGKNG